MTRSDEERHDEEPACHHNVSASTGRIVEIAIPRRRKWQRKSRRRAEENEPFLVLSLSPSPCLHLPLPSPSSSFPHLIENPPSGLGVDLVVLGLDISDRLLTRLLVITHAGGSTLLKSGYSE